MNPFEWFKRKAPEAPKTPGTPPPIYGAPPEDKVDLASGKIELNSPTWHYIRAWAKKGLQELREKNDNINFDDIQTAAIRGEIKALKRLLALQAPAVKGLLEEDE